MEPDNHAHWEALAARTAPGATPTTTSTGSPPVGAS